MNNNAGAGATFYNHNLTFGITNYVKYAKISYLAIDCIINTFFKIGNL
jgi:hypothetical protein